MQKTYAAKSQTNTSFFVLSEADDSRGTNQTAVAASYLSNARNGSSNRVAMALVEAFGVSRPLKFAPRLFVSLGQSITEKRVV